MLWREIYFIKKLLKGNELNPSISPWYKPVSLETRDELTSRLHGQKNDRYYNKNINNLLCFFKATFLKGAYITNIKEIICL